MEKKQGSRRRRSPSSEKTAQTKGAILAAATKMFLDKGFADCRMDQIAARAGVAKGLLYVYYPDKIALFRQVIHELAQEPLDTLERLRPNPGESVRSFLLRNGPRLLRDFGKSRRAGLLRLVLTEGSRFPIIAAMYRQLSLDPLKESIRNLAHLALTAGELHSDALVRFPELLTTPALLSAIGESMYPDGKNAPPEELFAVLINAFFREKATRTMRRAAAR